MFSVSLDAENLYPAVRAQQAAENSIIIIIYNCKKDNSLFSLSKEENKNRFSLNSLRFVSKLSGYSVQKQNRYNLTYTVFTFVLANFFPL